MFKVISVCLQSKETYLPISHLDVLFQNESYHPRLQIGVLETKALLSQCINCYCQ
jgi:hypothetical protein